MRRFGKKAEHKAERKGETGVDVEIKLFMF